MNCKVLLYILVLLPFGVHAQQYDASIRQYREGYKMSLLKGQDSLPAVDTGYLRFYEPNPDYCAKATFEQVTGTAPFRLPTRHGRIGPTVREYGIVYFNMKGASITLHVYRIMTKPKFRVLARAIDNPEENVILFIPFSDRTNNKETFMGGRYLDISAANLQSGNIVIDFNKACNPHTAYSMGYPYIIMPSVPVQSTPLEVYETRRHPDEPSHMETVEVNALNIEIQAGEKVFGHDPGY